ncbi:nuclear transport factor 2 family protein [Saccharopolyspora sp. TS4A08]|uniref:Nuclear transport factor 2 family protein n=1 Tax=Saccharopolyspora ipomoeae TaxID=3042027 RepID=A0ABT6PQR2_9PSEU|nr:nuclear transport factor 2 family protein [Saccharopolyspora sp. TS4A08]MDI2030180.1 nuclear transport factor 2 family protein [Saccharopolyspora sp. TS4A08]
MTDTDLADLTRRITRLEDVRAIEQLKFRYAAFCDDGYDPDGIASCFADDGRWVVDGEGGSMVGHEEIKAHFRALSKKISWALHHVLNPQVELDEDGRTATGHFYLLCLCTIESLDDPTEKDPVLITIHYTDQFVKRDGRWYFQELLGKTHQVSNWDQGWVKQPLRG